MSLHPVLIDRGRGPEIAGTRITVYDILDYSTQGWHHTAIASVLGVSSRQVISSLEYIEVHKDEIMPAYREMVERAARGNPPELQAKLDAIVAEGRARRAGAKRQSKEDAVTQLEIARDGNRRG